MGRERRVEVNALRRAKLTPREARRPGLCQPCRLVVFVHPRDIRPGGVAFTRFGIGER